MEETTPQQRLRFRTARRISWVIAGCAALSAGLLIAPLQNKETREAAALMLAEPELNTLPIQPTNVRWGFSLDAFKLFEYELQRGDILGTMLLEQGMTHEGVSQLILHSKDVFSLTSMRVGKMLNFLTRTPGDAPEYMVYEPSPYEYVLFQLTPPYAVERIQRDVKTELAAASGMLETSFWQAMTDNGLNDAIADGLIDVLATQVDFYRQKQGDRFKVVYEKHIVEGREVGTGQIPAAVYERDGEAFYAFFNPGQDKRVDYFDYDGRPARKAFLKAPVKYSRISSRYSQNRLHPVLGYHKAHYGTDYAAPYGTPIIAVSDGVVEEAGRKGGNGNYVKIRHDQTYETQYLHMRGFAKGIRRGAHVMQGQVIGYVGATGLATGPHVCFRFWRNGKQVDHLRLNLPNATPLTGEPLAAFEAKRDSLMLLLNDVQYRTREEIIQENAETQLEAKIKP
jgi:murein DD-endopeptidase MepM/ murein hydrolase activator NlpD